jgi:hypothetical protein
LITLCNLFAIGLNNCINSLKIRGIKPKPAKVKPILNISRIDIMVPEKRVESEEIKSLGIIKKTNPPLNAKIIPMSNNL